MYKILFTAVILSACKSFVYVPHVLDDNTEIIYSDGHAISVSHHENSMVLLTGTRTDNNLLAIKVGIQNGNERFNFFPESIKVIGVFEEKHDDTYPSGEYAYGEHEHYVYDPDEYLKNIRTNHAIALALYGFSQGYGSASAGYSQSNTNYSGRVSNGYNQVNVQGSSTTTTYDASKAYSEQRQRTQDMVAVASGVNRSYNATESGLLKRVTLFPGDYVEGNIMVGLDPGKSDVLRIEVPINGFTHMFYLYEE